MYIGYAIGMGKNDKTGWAVITYDAAGHAMDLRGSDDPFEATIFDDYVKAMNALDEINNMLEGAITQVVTFHLETEGPQ